MASDLSSKELQQIDFESLANQSTSLDDLIGKLPEDLLRYYTLMHGTGSEHFETTDYQSPRAILFGKDARTLVAFTEMASFAEVIQYDEKSGRSTFFTLAEAEVAGVKKVRLNKDDSECRGCHTTALRPNWDPYFFWMGAYGSEDDSYAVDGRELSELKKLIPSLENRDRYRHLVSPEKVYGEPRFSNGVSRLDETSEIVRSPSNPNFAFFIALAKQNAKRIAKYLLAQKNYKEDKYLIAATLAGCLMELSEEGPRVRLDYRDTLLQKDQRISLLNNFDRAVLDKMGGFEEFIRGGNVAHLVYLDQKLGLGMDMSIDKLGTHINGRALEKFSVPERSQFITAYFNDGTLDYSPMVVLRGLALFDKAFAGLEQFACKNGANVVNILDQEFQGYSYCGSYEESILTKEKTCQEIIQRWKN